MIYTHLKNNFKLLFFIILFLFVCQPVKSQTPAGAIHALPTEITLSGRLLDGDSIGEIGIPNAYIFALANDYKTILGFSKTQNGAYPKRGSWEIAGLPTNENIVLIGFHPNAQFLWVVREVKTGIFNKDVGNFIIEAGPYHDPEFGGGGWVGLANLIAHEAGVFILDNQLKTQENLIEYLLNEAKKIDNDETETIKRTVSAKYIFRLTKEDDKEALMESIVQEKVNKYYSKCLNEYKSICGISESYIKCEKTVGNNGACLIFTAEGCNVKFILTIDCDFTWIYVDSIKK